jgi:DNA-binding MarR family transcriptional regulator
MATSDNAEREDSPGKVESEIDLLIRLLKLGSFINTPMKDGVCDPRGISQLELKLMMALAGEGALAGHDLVEIMGVPAMNVSRAAASLKTRGWVEDVADAGNRRRKPMRLTAQGEAEYAGLGPSLDAVAAALLGSLTARQKEQFARLSDQVIAGMARWITSHHDGVKLRG